MNDDFDNLISRAVSGDTAALNELRGRCCKSKGGRPPSIQRDFELSMWVCVATDKFSWKRNNAFDHAGDKFKTSSGAPVGCREARRIYAKTIGKKPSFTLWFHHVLSDCVFCLGIKAPFDMQENPAEGRMRISFKGTLKEGVNCFVASFPRSEFG